jgi:hypothetical protein
LLATKFPIPDQIKPDHRLWLMDQGQGNYNINISNELLFQLGLGAQHFMRNLPLSTQLEQSNFSEKPSYIPPLVSGTGYLLLI